MDVSELLSDAFGRVSGHVDEILDGLDTEAAVAAPADGANPIGWLIWHLTRVQDHHISELLEQEQVWIQQGFAPRFGIEPDPDDVGYGHTPEQVVAVRPESAAALRDYFAAVDERTRGLLETVTSADLDRIVDRRWDPPVTMGVRLVSVVDDEIQHAGQAAYVKGLLERR